MVGVRELKAIGLVLCLSGPFDQRIIDNMSRLAWTMILELILLEWLSSKVQSAPFQADRRSSLSMKRLETFYVGTLTPKSVQY